MNVLCVPKKINENNLFIYFIKQTLFLRNSLNQVNAVRKTINAKVRYGK